MPAKVSTDYAAPYKRALKWVLFGTLGAFLLTLVARGVADVASANRRGSTNVEYIVVPCNDVLQPPDYLDKEVKFLYNDKPIAHLSYTEVLILNRSEMNFDNIDIELVPDSPAIVPLKKLIVYRGSDNPAWYQWHSGDLNDLAFHVRRLDAGATRGWDVTIRLFYDGPMASKVSVRTDKAGVHFVPYQSYKFDQFIRWEILLPGIVGLMAIIASAIIIAWIASSVRRRRRRAFARVFARSFREYALTNDLLGPWDIVQLACATYTYTIGRYFRLSGLDDKQITVESSSTDVVIDDLGDMSSEFRPGSYLKNREYSVAACRNA